MKILLLGNFGSSVHPIHGLAEGLEECGYECVRVDSKIKRRPKVPTFPEYVAQKAEDCDTVLICKGHGPGHTIGLRDYNLIIEKCPDTTYLLWDSVSGSGCGPPCRPKNITPRGMPCSRIILTGTEGARWFRKQGYEGRIAQIYQGCRHRIWKPGTYPRGEQNRLCFFGIGSYTGDGGRRPKFEAIRNAGFKIFHSNHLFHEKAANAYWNSAICLNFVCGDLTSNRLMRILSSGGFCLTEQNVDIDHSFTDGVELAKFKARDIPGMLEQVKRYMAQPELRDEIAMRGHEWTRDKSWAHQAEKIVRFIQGEDIPADGAAGEYATYQDSTD